MGFYLEKAGRSYQILERGDAPGAFFERFPRHRKLLSINKIHTGYDDPEINLRWDWNSLLSDHDDTATFKHFSREYFPDADDLVRYLGAYARQSKLKIRFHTPVVRVSKDSRFRVVDDQGNVYTSRVLVVATGCWKPNVPEIPGIEYGENYNEMPIDPDDFSGQRVLILGKGNSAFETANHLLGAASLMHLASPHSIKMAWRTHYVGHIRAINNAVLDSYLLKSQNALLDGEVKKIERRDGKLVATVAYSHASGEVEELVYDRVLVCTGFRFDDSIFDESCRPATVIDGRFPDQTSEWESTNVPDLYFAGTLMQMRDFKKKQSAFIHGFRYNIDLLHRIFEQKYHDRRMAYRTLPRDPQAIVEHLIYRADHSSALWQQTGFLCDLLIVPRDGGDVRYYEDLALDYVHDHWPDCAQYYTLTMEFGQERIDASPDVFAVSRVHKGDTDGAELSTAVHPIVRRFCRGQPVNTHHVIEDLASEFHEDVHVLPLLEYFKKELGLEDRQDSDGPRCQSREQTVHENVG
jgi:thioredoxin reductase